MLYTSIFGGVFCFFDSWIVVFIGVVQWMVCMVFFIFKGIDLKIWIEIKKGHGEFG